MHNLALQERRLRNQQRADINKLEALQKERLEKPNEKARVQERMYDAMRMLLNAEKLDIPFNPAQFGFEFSVHEIMHCYQALASAERHHQPIPFVVDLLAALRNTQKEAKAA